jgi:YegS/Rv2252/BmrU family lipid kinase
MYNIIINPASGKGASLKALEIVEATLKANNAEYTVYNTEKKCHATEIMRELSKTPDTKVIAMGGDGSFNEVLNGIENFENITLGFVPCGSGNDFIKSLGYPKGIKETVELILKGDSAYVDYIDLGSRRCLNVAGTGIDVDVLVNFEKFKMFKGSARYMISLLYTLTHVKWHKLRLTINGESLEREVFMIGVGNGQFIGGGMPVCPNAAVDDDMLNIVVINKMKKTKILPALLKFLKGKHLSMPATEEFNAKEIKIEVLDEGKIETDGEIIDDKILDCRVVPGKLRIFK